jgi:hypothetical protein
MAIMVNLAAAAAVMAADLMIKEWEEEISMVLEVVVV